MSVGQVHWHEGLFLQPHHLQAMQRAQGEMLRRERRLSMGYPYGVSELRISTDALENMLVRLDRLRAVMPSGLEVDVPGNCDLPALDIKRAFQSGSGSFVVSLAAPLWQPDRANTVGVNGSAAGGGEDARVKRLFRVSEVNSPDENTGENPQPMLMRRVNARLVVEGEDTTDLELIPLLRIQRAGDEKTLPRADEGFVPPCLTISGSPKLKNHLRALAAAVEAARRDVVSSLTRGGWVVEQLRGQSMLDLLRLRTLGRFAGSLPTLVNGGVGGPISVTPLEVYLELRELLGELAALSPDRDPFESSAYDHDNPWPVFDELDRKIRSVLRGGLRKRYMQAPFTQEAGVLVATLADEHIKDANGYLLGIKTKMDPTKLATLVEDGDKFKLMPRSMAKLNVYGVKLEEERHAPMELPSATDLHYFRLQIGESQKMWDRAVQEKSIAIKWPEADAFEYTDVQLYMTTP